MDLVMDESTASVDNESDALIQALWVWVCGGVGVGGCVGGYVRACVCVRVCVCAVCVCA